MQTTRYLVRVVVELAARMQYRHDHFCRRAAFLLMNIHGDTATIITYCDGFIVVDRHADILAVTGQRLINCIVDHLKHHVMQAGTIIRITDVHTRSLADRIQPLEYLDGIAIVIGRV